MRQVLGQLKNTYPSNEELEYFAVDDLGSRKVLYSSDGAANAKFDYSAYGTCTKTLGADSHWYLASFTKKEYDATGLIYFNARYYDPTLGRFLAEDPSQKGTSWYTYCGNNPLSFTDPAGKKYESAASAELSGNQPAPDQIGREPDSKGGQPPSPSVPPTPPVAPPPNDLTPEQQKNLKKITDRYKDIEYGEIDPVSVPPGTKATPFTIPGTDLPGLDVQEPASRDHYYAYDSNNDGVYDTKIDVPDPQLSDFF